MEILNFLAFYNIHLQATFSLLLVHINDTLSAELVMNDELCKMWKTP